jgi:hypothetical protein
LPRTRLQQHVDQLNAADKPRVVQIDEATLEQRQKDTAAWLADPQNQAEMEASKAALEAEIASREGAMRPRTMGPHGRRHATREARAGEDQGERQGGQAS